MSKPVSVETPRQIAGRIVKEWVEHDLDDDYGEFSTQWPTELLISRFVDALIAHGQARDERAVRIIQEHQDLDVCWDNCWTTIKVAIGEGKGVTE